MKIKALFLLPFYVQAAPSDSFNPPANDICEGLGPLPCGLSAWALIGIASTLFLACAIAAYFMWRRRKSSITPPTLTPHEAAIKQLEIAREWMQGGQDSRFATELTKALREYLANAWNLPAPECTTEEFLSSLAQDKQFIENQKAPLEFILREADLAKFAKMQFPEEARSTLFQKAQNWLQAVHQEHQRRLQPPSQP